MNRLILLLVFTICCFYTKAQDNLVYNGDFELRTQCPDNISQMHYVDGWRRYTLGSSDYFSTCKPTAPLSSPTAPGNFFGSQMPLSGDCYTGGYSFSVMYGFFTTATEYIAGRLKQPMQPGTAYEVSFSTSLAELISGVGNNSLGVYFYKDAPDTVYTATTLTSLTPQITFLDSGCITEDKKWVRMVSEFVADSAYDNLVIGMFYLPGKFQYSGMGGACYYYYDSVFVRVARLNNLFNDTALCVGQAFEVPYSLVPGTKIYNGNIFTAELSDSTGSFASATTLIGTLADTADGVIRCVVPATVTPGTQYRIRVLSSKPIRISEDNGKDIRIDRSPDVTIISTTPLCEGDLLKLTSDAGVTNVTYYWQGPNGFTSSQNNDTIAGVTMAAGGQYILTTKYHGCTAYDTTTVQVKHRPVIPKLESNSPLSAGDILKLNITNPEANVDYVWSGPLKFSSTSTSPEIKNITREQEGIYKVLVTLNGCSSSSLIFVSVGDASATSYLLYPNPNNGDFTFVATTKTDQYISIWIYNSSGQLVYKERPQTQNKKLKLNIKLRDALSSDVYMMRMMIDGKQLSTKFTVSRGQ